MRSLFFLSLTLLISIVASADENPASGDLQDALKAVTDKVEKHDWLGLLEWTDDAHRAEQMGIGMTHAQYIAEILNLNWENNSINAVPGTEISEQDLNRIRKVIWRTQKPDGNGWTVVTGTVKLKGFKTLLIETNWIQTEEGWRMTGPVG